MDIHPVFKLIDTYQMFPRNACVLVGVSGGSDSVALLHFLQSNQTLWGIRIIAISVDHGLRGRESEEDCLFVKELCKKWKIPFEAEKVDVKSYKANNKLGTQQAARDLRYKVFQEKMEQYGASVLALAHHGDDQVETFIMKLSRTVEPSHLKGIPVSRPFGNGQIVRPFLLLTKEDIYQYCQNHHLSFREDPSNFETNYTRNAYRHHVLPFLKRQNPKIHEHLHYFNKYHQEDESFFLQQALSAFNEIVEVRGTKEIMISGKKFTKLENPLQRRVFHLILNYLYEQVQNPVNLSFIHTEQFLHLLHSGQAHSAIHFPHGLLIIKSYDDVLFSFDQSGVEPFEISFTPPATITLPNGMEVKSIYSDKLGEEGVCEFVCEGHNVQLPLWIRTRRDGDRMKVRGLNGHKKIKDLFIDEKIPKIFRDQWPILTDNKGQILWVIGLRKSERGFDSSSTGTRIRITVRTSSLTWEEN
ncbi:tRNA lysidine(34) synthetase TilS [Bacillaceae bacterium S4-13-58]